MNMYLPIAVPGDPRVGLLGPQAESIIWTQTGPRRWHVELVPLDETGLLKIWDFWCSQKIGNLLVSMSGHVVMHSRDVLSPIYILQGLYDNFVCTC